jgi:hypothetical protein
LTYDLLLKLYVQYAGLKSIVKLLWQKNETRDHDETGSNWKNSDLLETC